MAIKITGIEKQGPIIVCFTDDAKNRTYKIDFKEGKVYGISGNALQSTSTIVKRVPYELTMENPLYPALAAFVSSSYRDTTYYAVVESLLSYPDLLPRCISTDLVNYIVGDFNGKLPKGFVAWCRSNGIKFSAHNLEEFFLQQKLSQWPKALVDTVKRFSDGSGFNLVKETNYDKELCASLMRIINNSLKRYEIGDLISKLYDIIRFLKRNPTLRPYLDDTKSAKTAYQILNDVLFKERNDKILANEAKIASLNDMVIGEFVVKVPSTMGDFTNEGEQQHNCVGYYYHDAMERGNTLIYFLRLPHNPDKSYVTCRFDTYHGRTVEARRKNNVWFDEYPEVFEQIDRMIKRLVM